jgi:hypothetical protein
MRGGRPRPYSAARSHSAGSPPEAVPTTTARPLDEVPNHEEEEMIPGGLVGLIIIIVLLIWLL